MAREAKICRGSWCLAFGFPQPASLEQVVKVLSAFGYDGIELAGFFDHATIERYPDKESRKKLVDWIHSHDLEIVGYAPGPVRRLRQVPVGDRRRRRRQRATSTCSSRACSSASTAGSRRCASTPATSGRCRATPTTTRPGTASSTTFKAHAERGRELGVKMLWELETGQIFVKPSEAVKLLDDVDDDNLQLMFDVGHVEAACVLAHNQVQPAERLEGGATEFARMLKGKIGHVHVCDSDSNTWQNAFGTHLGIGKGVIDFDELIPALADGLRRRVVVGGRDPDDRRVVGGHLERPVHARRAARQARPRAERR